MSISTKSESDLVEVSGHGTGRGVVTSDYDPRLANEDLAPLDHQTWSWYNIFAFWMSDVHSVGGYVTAGSLFALGLTSWQVFVCLIVGISIVLFLCNLVAKPSQRAGVPYPVICRSVFGVRGANIPAIIRGLIAFAWYGIQTYLASASLDILLVRLWPTAMATTRGDLRHRDRGGLLAVVGVRARCEGSRRLQLVHRLRRRLRGLFPDLTEDGGHRHHEAGCRTESRRDRQGKLTWLLASRFDPWLAG